MEYEKGFEQESTEKSIAKAAVSEWCELNGVDIAGVPELATIPEKAEVYDAVFEKGSKKFLEGFLAQQEAGTLDLPAIKSELDALREQGDMAALGKKEVEVAKLFQTAISAYGYDQVTSHPADVLKSRVMNCVSASWVGGMLLEEVGERVVLATGGAHVFLIMATSDHRVLWQDMQDGKEVPEFNNGELTADNIVSESVTPEKIDAFIQNPKKEGMSFVTNKVERWKDEPITIYPFLPGIKSHVLVNTGFKLRIDGKYLEALEVLAIAEHDSPNAPEVYLGQALALRELSRYEEALAACKKALEIDPDYSFVRKQMEEITELLPK
jgi:tetratricopeptide (TPR) repeat protein